jgi:hypothetical protein
MEKKRTNNASLSMFIMLVALVSQNLVIVPVIANTIKDHKNYQGSSPSDLSTELCKSLTLLYILYFFYLWIYLLMVWF